jgi:hypothetical protein
VRNSNLTVPASIELGLVIISIALGSIMRCYLNRAVAFEKIDMQLKPGTARKSFSWRCPLFFIETLPAFDLKKSINHLYKIHVEDF